MRARGRNSSSSSSRIRVDDLAVFNVESSKARTSTAGENCKPWPEFGDSVTVTRSQRLGGMMAERERERERDR